MTAGSWLTCNRGAGQYAAYLPRAGQAAAFVCNFSGCRLGQLRQASGSASGRVSGITSQAISIPAAATPAMLQNVMALPK
jgi:hypothetical protein